MADADAPSAVHNLIEHLVATPADEATRAKLQRTGW